MQITNAERRVATPLAYRTLPFLPCRRNWACSLSEDADEQDDHFEDGDQDLQYDQGEQANHDYNDLDDPN